MRKLVVAPQNVWDPKEYGFAHGIMTEDSRKMLFLSGQNGIDKKGNVVGKDFESQCTQAYQNIASILASVGGAPSNVVRVTAYVTDIRNSDKFVNISREFFKGELCSQTLLEVKALAFPDLNVELEAIAVL